MRLRPTKGHAFILPETTGPTSSLLVIPGIAQNKAMPEIGKVVAMSGAFRTKTGIIVQPEFKIGDRVFVKKYTGLFVDFQEVRYFSVPIHDVMAVLE